MANADRNPSPRDPYYSQIKSQSLNKEFKAFQGPYGH